jgi:hypothetical protein
MMAKIFYCSMTDPRDDEWWYQNVYKKVHHELDDESPISIPSNKFTFYWKLMGTEVKKEDDSHHFLNELYALYNGHGSNGEKNPLANPDGQAKIRALGVRHTSMSIGDVISIDGKYWIVAGIGFRELIIG